MMFTTRMKQVVAVVLDSDAEKVTKELLDLSLLHFINIKELSSGWESKLEGVTPKVSLAIIGELRKRIESFLSVVDYNPGDQQELDIKKLTPLDLEKARKELNKIADKIHEVRERQRLVQQEILKFEDIKRQLELFGDLKMGIHAKSRYSFLNIQTGAIKTININNFEQALGHIPSVHLTFGKEENHTNVLLITMKKDDGRVNEILNQFGWADINIEENLSGLQDDVNVDLESKLKKLKTEQKTLEGESENLISTNKTALTEMWENLRMNELYYNIQSYFTKTTRTVVFSGWLPASKQPLLEKAIKNSTSGRYYMEWHTPKEVPEDLKVPVKFNNPKFLAPFQMLVTNFAVPEYGTVEPTILVAIAYLCMFGLMFGDVGQGIVLMIVGILGTIFTKGKADQGIRNLLKLGIWCGGAATIAGVLFGSYFGFAWAPPQWFDYHGIIAGHTPKTGMVKDINGILAVSINFGIVMISIGLILNWINLVAKKKWFNLIFDKGGILGVWIYAAGVYTAFYYVGASYKAFPAGNQLFWFFGVPAMLFALKPPIEFIIHKKHNPGLKFTAGTIMDFFMEFVIEMLEVFSGYLANTLSFMRIAGLGIAHTSLMMAFYEISQMVNSGPEGTWSIPAILILVLGNVLVLVLEGLSAGIQSLRLNYYEFFSKYFIGSGEVYAPVSLRKML